MDKASTDQTLKVFQTRVRQMVLSFRQLKKENDQLRSELDNAKGETAELKQKLQTLQDDFEAYKMAKIMEVSDEDLETAKKKLSKLVRDVNKCIAVLTEKD